MCFHKILKKLLVGLHKKSDPAFGNGQTVLCISVAL